MNYDKVNKIMVLGDSVSKGVVLNEDKGRYVFSPRRFLARLDQEIGPDILDHSKFGTTTAHGKAILEKNLPLERPDLVFIEYGSNDSDYAWDDVARNPGGRHDPALSLREYAQNLRDMIRSVRERGSIPILTNLHPLVGDRYFRWFTHGDRQRQKETLRWLGSSARIYWWQEMYSYEAERVGREADVPVLDIRGAFLRQKNLPDLFCSDGIHPNENGHALLYQAILFYIKRSAPSWLA